MNSKWDFRTNANVQFAGTFDNCGHVKENKKLHFSGVAENRSCFTGCQIALIILIRYLFQSPFLYPVNSYEHLVSCAENLSSNIYHQMSQMLVTLNRVPPPHTALMVSPPLPAGIQVPGMPNGAPGYMTTYQQAPVVVGPPVVGLAGPFSQPPSEPADEIPSSASNTPEDSDTGWVPQNVVSYSTALHITVKVFSNVFK